MNVLKREYRLRTSDFDRYDRILPAAIMDIFQDMAGEHANYIGIGYDDLKRENLFWILMRVKYEVIKYPKLYSAVTAKTWPHEPQRLEFIRDFEILDEDGEILIKGTSLWAVLNMSTRKMVMAENIKPTVENYYDKVTFEGRFMKLANFDVTEDMLSYEVQSAYTDIDINGHVNNIKYTNYVMNTINLPASEKIKFLQIDYKKEVREGERLFMYHLRNGNIIMCKGCNEAGETMFITKIEIEEN